MCLRPRKIINKSKCISLTGGQPLYITVPCGCCAECLKAKRDEYIFRTWYQCMDTFRHEGGYVYFDTLTYDNKHLPHLSDYFDCVERGAVDDWSCFSFDDFRYFMVRLRRRLEYDGFDVKNNLKYFMTTEYGEKDEGTHRPHYHILFFVTDSKLDPFVLSMYVDECWQKGRTDGINYNDRSHVLNHIYTHEGDGMRIVSKYVAKYVTKDTNFIKQVDERFKYLCKKKFGFDNEIESKQWEKEINAIKRHLYPFHRQSQGYGIYAFDCSYNKDMYETGMITMPDKTNVYKHIPIPLYYKMKMFYDLVVEEDGTKRWQLNEIGKNFKDNRVSVSIKTLSKQFKDWYDNFSNYSSDDDPFMTKVYIDSFKQRIDQCLDGRDWSELAVYQLYYRGRILPREYYDKQEYPDVYEMLGMSYDDPYKSKYKVNNYTHDELSIKCLSPKSVDEVISYCNDLDDSWQSDFLLGFGVMPTSVKNKLKFRNRVYSLEQFTDYFVVDQDYNYDFRYFDDLLDIYQFMCWFKNVKKQKAFDFSEQLKYKLKCYSENGHCLTV